ncbi:nuclear transport factor 2 family protein [Nocardia cyriacigeorgica]|uniref:Ketosteroid isomerase-related protein n=1 Tax=Nocardia cyriacigeorgica TaxID=135487 RepID=A0A4U8W816_9NOCA|nr:nuclear transport factor 2 family protein [Nocardia cyriacigeorgica]MBF6098736.1 nuclear transport factor 2 family protein [Nocardia cyriacigeorgica]MBF6161946.1 nuclear transport factor 2 family protein [Nocardia cyriacigeorgica]MBF6200744.1 nuclear transport factor 2 family protein [Nocardia cyriacigeorgica]MBF6317458.1 nuclear transport factor 2 family protein [Nocardia cyriacigeorgica]MBF6531990.1 nuclear transport factor 2 family protein [Nocardia cyriacigeorgica]
MSSNVEIVRKMYSDLAEGNFDAIFEALAPDVEWAEPELEYLPYPGLTKGRDNVAAEVFAKIPGVYEKIEFIPEVLIDGGATVTVMGPATTKGPYGAAEHFRFAHVVRVEGGKVVRFDHFVDTHKIARTLSARPDSA